MKHIKERLSRRNFITTITGTSGALILAPMAALAFRANDPTINKIVKNTIGIDTHNHIDVPLDTDELPGPKLDLSGEIRKSGLSAIVMTFATDYKRNVRPGEAYQRFLNGLTAMDKALADNNIKRALTLADIQSAHTQHQPIVAQAIEGCHFLEGKKGRVEIAYKRGLRHLGLLHDSDASVPLGDVYTNTPQLGGLTTFGAEVIKEANRLGMLIDLTHGNNETINAALKISTTPIIITHTGLDTQLGQNSGMAKMMRPRLISKEQAKKVADAGGVIGVWTHLSDTPAEYAQNIKAMSNVVGIEHVCIGTDTKLTTPYQPAGGGSEGVSGGTLPGSGAPGNRSDSGAANNRSTDGPPHDDKAHQRAPPGSGKHIGERTNEAWEDEKVGFYYAVVEALLKAGFTEEEIGKISSGNYCRVFDMATRG